MLRQWSSSGNVQLVALLRASDDFPDAFTRDHLSRALSVLEFHHHPVFVNFKKHILLNGGVRAGKSLVEASHSRDNNVRVEEVEKSTQPEKRELSSSRFEHPLNKNDRSDGKDDDSHNSIDAIRAVARIRFVGRRFGACHTSHQD